GGSATGPVPPVGSLANMPVPSYPVPSPPSVWVRVRDLCNFVLIITGASYGVYHMYKNYIGPLLTGRKQKSVDESMIELQQSVVAVLKEVQSTLATLEQSLSAQNVRIQSLSAREEKGHTSQQIEELKTEITSLKGLLINRRTFPSTPSMSPSIPSWQLSKTTEKALEKPSVSVATLPTEIQNESVKPEEHLVGNCREDPDVVAELICEEPGVIMNCATETHASNPASCRENGQSADESLSLMESAGDSSDEMSQ
ncbi:peroxisomal membrane protein pex14, partial [Halocaridina rubra]